MLDNFAKMAVSKKVAILVVLVMVVAALFWFLKISHARDQLAKLERENKTLKTKLEDVKIREKTYNEDRKRRDDLEIASVKQRMILPSESEMASFLNSLNVVADLAGIELKSVKPLAESPEAYYARIPVMLELSGSYHQIAKFFYQIGKLDRVINVENIILENPVLSESGTMLSAKFMATTFRALSKDPGAKKTSTKK